MGIILDKVPPILFSDIVAITVLSFSQNVAKNSSSVRGLEVWKTARAVSIRSTRCARRMPFTFLKSTDASISKAFAVMPVTRQDQSAPPMSAVSNVFSLNRERQLKNGQIDRVNFASVILRNVIHSAQL